MKYKYRIIKRSDKPYYILEERVISRFKFLDKLKQWESIDVNENVEWLERKVKDIIKRRANPIPEITVIKEYDK